MQMRTGHRELSPGTALTFTPSQPGCPSSKTSELDGLGNLTKDTTPACGPTNSDPSESRAEGAKRNVHPNSLGGGADFNFPSRYTSWASLVAQSVKNLPAMQETWVRFLGREDPLEKETATTPVCVIFYSSPNPRAFIILKTCTLGFVTKED